MWEYDAPPYNFQGDRWVEATLHLEWYRQGD